MSHQANTDWVAGAWESFEIALFQGNYPLAKDIIADTKDAGFGAASLLMEQMLKDSPVQDFLHASPIQRYEL